mmetsp:Transcript_3911/g.9984  ORF Transcript_3911/g.9984 Transcript_3911/m.9984 type:complete len:561 (-) Transcript_3911:75-1757(-)
MLTDSAVVPGTFSQLGRDTARGIKRLNTKVELADLELKARTTSTEPAEADAEPSPAPISRGRFLSRKGTASSLDRVARIGAPAPTPEVEVDTLAPTEEADAVEDEAPKAELSSSVFRSKGQQDPRYDDKARALLGRWVSPTNDDFPEAGRYQPVHSLVLKRNPKWDFSKTQGRKSRKAEDDADEMRRTTLSMASTGASGFGSSMHSLNAASMTSTSEGWKVSPTEQFDVMSPHKQLFGRGAIAPGRQWLSAPQFLREEVSEMADSVLQQDRKTKSSRPPEWDFEKVASRKAVARDTFFEPGKYRINLDSVGPKLKTGVHHGKALDRSKIVVTHHALRMLLEPDSADSAGKVKTNKGIICDRSLHRDTAETRPRVTHVREMEKVGDRPPLYDPVPMYHDQDDPEADAEVLHREMAIDRSTLDLAVTSRRDLAPDMLRSATRDVANRGNRFAQTRSAGLVPYPATLGERVGSVEACKERPSRAKSDTLVRFEKVKGRQKGNYMNLSALRRPRDMAFGDFERLAPLPGFAPRITANIPQVLRPSRTFEALPGFDATAFDEVET